MIQKSKLKNYYLENALKDLTEAEEIGINTLEELDIQNETINHISSNLQSMNSDIDISEKNISIMEGRWCFGRNTKKLKLKYKLEQSTWKKNNKKIIMQGIIKKKSDWLKIWKERYFFLQDDRLIYQKKKNSSKILGEIILKEYNINSYKLKTGFGLKLISPAKIYYFKLDKRTDFSSWKRHINDTINKLNEQKINSNESNINFYQRQIIKTEDVLLDKINESLGNLDEMARMMNGEIIEQNIILENINHNVEQTDNRLKHNIKRMKKL